MQLRHKVRALEFHRPVDSHTLPLKVSALDAALSDGGLMLNCVHEVHGSGRATGAAMGFVLGLLRLMLAGPILWIGRNPNLYTPGLQIFGIAHSDIFILATSKPDQTLWAMEEGLRWPGLRAVVAEIDCYDLTATRRLQLAAEAGGVTGFLISPAAQDLTSCSTRWRISPMPGLTPQAIRNPAWDVNLVRCRGGRPAHANLLWRGDRFEDLNTQRQQVRA